MNEYQEAAYDFITTLKKIANVVAVAAASGTEGLLLINWDHVETAMNEKLLDVIAYDSMAREHVESVDDEYDDPSALETEEAFELNPIDPYSGEEFVHDDEDA